MKRIGLITTNRVLAQSLAAAMNSHPELGFEPFLLLNPNQATLDAEVLRIDAAVIDVTDRASDEAEVVLTCCKMMRQKLPACRLLLLVSQEDQPGRRVAITIFAPLLVAGLVCFAFLRQMKTAVPQRAADHYIQGGGFVLTARSDTFLFKTETRITIVEKKSGGTTTDRGGFSGTTGKF